MHMILNNTHFHLSLHCLLHINQIIINNSAYMHRFSDSSTLHSPALIDLKKSHEDYVDVFWVRQLALGGSYNIFASKAMRPESKHFSILSKSENPI